MTPGEKCAGFSNWNEKFEMKEFGCFMFSSASSVPQIMETTTQVDSSFCSRGRYLGYEDNSFEQSTGTKNLNLTAVQEVQGTLFLARSVCIPILFHRLLAYAFWFNNVSLLDNLHRCKTKHVCFVQRTIFCHIQIGLSCLWLSHDTCCSDWEELTKIVKWTAMETVCLRPPGLMFYFYCIQEKHIFDWIYFCFVLHKFMFK